MDGFARYCIYVLAIFTMGLGIHYVLNYLYPPLCENCKKMGGAQTVWAHMEAQKPKRRIEEHEDEIDEDL